MQSYYKIWIHVTWGTKNRVPYLKKNIRPEIFQHIREKANAEGYMLDMVNGVEDHVHCLLSLNPKFAISEIINKLKGESSHWINAEKILPSKFAWQNGFGAFSVSESIVDKVREYILNQEEHHKRFGYVEEMEKLLKLHNLSLKR